MARIRRRRRNPLARRRRRRVARLNPIRRRRRRNPRGKRRGRRIRRRHLSKKRAKLLAAYGLKSNPRRRRRRNPKRRLKKGRKASRRRRLARRRRRLGAYGRVRGRLRLNGGRRRRRRNPRGRRRGRRGGARHSAAYRAMHLKTNPGLAGFINEAKQYVPQAGIALGSSLGIALIATKVADALSPNLTFVPAGAVPFIRPVTTALVTLGAVFAANKVAPKYKGAVALGGFIAAGLQTVSALTATATPGGIVDQAKKALGLGDYTMIGGRSYAEAGIFREVGDYTMVGDPYSTARPRPSIDNDSEWAALGAPSAFTRQLALIDPRAVRPRNTADNWSEMVAGLDDATEFAPGEGGVLSGGMFRGPSSR